MIYYKVESKLKKGYAGYYKLDRINDRLIKLNDHNWGDGSELVPMGTMNMVIKTKREKEFLKRLQEMPDVIEAKDKKDYDGKKCTYEDIMELYNYKTIKDLFNLSVINSPKNQKVMKMKIKLTDEQLESIISESKKHLETQLQKETETLNKLHEKAKEQLKEKYTKLISNLKKKYEDYEMVIPNDDDEIIGKTKGTRLAWDKDTCEQLLKLWNNNTPIKEISKVLGGRSVGSINQQIQKLKKDSLFKDRIKPRREKVGTTEKESKVPVKPVQKKK